MRLLLSVPEVLKSALEKKDFGREGACRMGFGGEDLIGGFDFCHIAGFLILVEME